MNTFFAIEHQEDGCLELISDHLVSILDAWSKQKCEYPKHRLIMFEAEHQPEQWISGWARRLDLAGADLKTLLSELEVLANWPGHGIRVCKFMEEK